MTMLLTKKGGKVGDGGSTSFKDGKANHRLITLLGDPFLIGHKNDKANCADNERDQCAP